MRHLFRLIFALPQPEADPKRHLDALFEVGCDDAVVGVGRSGYLALEFSRYGATREDTTASAIADVLRAVPGAVLVETAR